MSMVGACLLLTANDSIIKWLSGGYPLHEIVFIRAAVALCLALVFIWLEGGFHLLRTNRLGLHLVRGLLIAAANMAFFLGLATLPLAEAMAVFFAAPLFITAMSAVFLGENVGPARWIAVALGLCGVVIMLRPGHGTIEYAALLPLIAAIAYSVFQIMTRKLGGTEKASTLSFYLQLCFLITALGFGLMFGDGKFSGSGNMTLEFLFRPWIWPDGSDGALLIVLGILVAFGGYLLSQAYRSAEASVVAPFEYLSLPLGIFWGYVVWGDWPNLSAFIGIALIAGSGLFVFYREAKTRKLNASRRPLSRGR